MNPIKHPLAALAAGALALALTPAAGLAKRPATAKLALDDLGCPTQIDAPSCTDDVLTIGGSLGVSNAGAQTGQVSSVAVILEQHDAGNGDSFGPGAADYRFVGASTVSHYTACNTDGIAPTCYPEGNVAHSAGASTTYTPAAPPLPSVAPSACEELEFAIAFDLAALGLTAGDALRTHLAVSYDPARGKSSCELDADCDGVAATSAATVQLTDAFTLPPCDGSESDGGTDATAGYAAGSIALSEMSNNEGEVDGIDNLELNATFDLSVAGNTLTIVVHNTTDTLSSQSYDISAFDLNHSGAVSDVQLTAFPNADAGWVQGVKQDRRVGGFGRFDVAVKVLPDLTFGEVGLNPDLVNAGESETFEFSFDCSGTCDAGDFEVDNRAGKALAAKFINGGGLGGGSAWGASGAPTH